MKNFYLVITLLVFYCSLAQANVKLGIIGGGNYSNFQAGISRTVDLGGGDSASGQLGPSGSFGYIGGGFIRYEKETWALEADLLYTSRNTKWHGELRHSGAGPNLRNSMEFNFKQIEIPLIGQYIIPEDKFRYRVSMGLVPTYGIGKITIKDKYSATAGTVYQDTDKQTWQDFGIKRLNLGALIAFGVDINMSETSKLGFDLRAQSILNDMKSKINPNFGMGGASNLGLINVDLLVSYLF
jgi:hypothetical protein